MKLLRYGPKGREKPGMLDADGKIRDLSGKIDDIAGKTLDPKALAKLARLNPGRLPPVKGRPRLGPCVGAVSKFIGIGLNYADHAAEAGLPIPPEPIVFMKAVSSICGPNDDIMVPKGSTKLDYEVELGIVIGTRARHVTQKAALDHVAGFCVANDVSERDFQMRPGGQWDKGKGCDTFGPLGPWLVTTDEIANVQRLDMALDVNGERRQEGNTRTMIFSAVKIVSYVSQFMTLEPGDVIVTGTPPGVAMGMKPPRWLTPGDRLRLAIDGLGEQRQKVVPYRAS